MSTLVTIIHVLACLILMFVVLLQQGKGGGMGAALGGASTQVFGGRGAGNVLTKATAICAGIFMLTSVSLAYMSSSGDRALKARVSAEETKKKDRGTPREKAEKSEKSSTAPATSAAPSGGAPAPANSAAPAGSAPSP